MPQAFDKCKERPEHIDQILNNLNRYNPETTTTFQEYVTQQCEEKFFDTYACLALLKLYQFNPQLLHPETVTNILVKALTVFPSPAFSLCLSLLPPSTIPYQPGNTSVPTTDFTESIQKLTRLNTLLESAQYDAFWSTLESDDLYADLYADVAGFEDLVRIRIAGEVGKTFRQIDLGVLSGWLDLRGDTLAKFTQTACGWRVQGQQVEIPANAENEAKSEVKGERVGVDMFSRVFRRGYEAPA
ncbi:eukaryotic translation initiation factor 3 subunit K [Exophiala xenobiotica]|uniref:Eukaryotic translation initiation factor 3 subunit K n=1 Tax=Exophiala xenobiotica TaxID=348802 RepID=A0A0D2ES11_9EURO|nr:eukaryotic translation initiation factor 3 subunit K [Exophiala xenobiotica]KIW50604.1 eukaryotic translation initiation factor 3 subunit K [Exophiala xenobiotica]